MPVNSIGGGLPLLTPRLPSAGAAATSSSSDFGSALKQAVGALEQLGTRADTSSLALAKGDPIDIHEVMLNTEQASLGFSMAMQVRNKLVDAYQEIMRMSV